MQELERVLHDIDHSLSWIFVVLLWMLTMSYFNCHCEQTEVSGACKEACEKKSYEEPKLEPHGANGECWCYDPKSGKSERLW